MLHELTLLDVFDVKKNNQWWRVELDLSRLDDMFTFPLAAEAGLSMRLIISVLD